MPFWPFNRPPPTLRLRQLRRDIDALSLELIDLRETVESVLAAVKRIQGKTYRRKRAEIEAVSEEPPEAEKTPVNPANGAPQTLQYADPKKELRIRAAQLRGR